MTSASSGSWDRCSSCLYCASPAAHEHHLTGRPAPGAPYLDPALVVALCRSCHVGEHAALRRLGLDWPTGDLTAHRLARTAAVSVRLGDLGRPLVLDLGPTRALGGLLLAGAEVLRQLARVPA